METQRSFQQILIAVVFLSCFFVIFYMYHNPPINWLHCPTVQVSKPNDGTDAFIKALKKSDNTQITDNNFTQGQKQFKPFQPNPTHPPQTETLLLIWMWPFGIKFDLGSCSSKFKIEGCQLTDDRTLFNKAHGVLFHHGDISEDLSNMPMEPRPYFQKWVWMNMESPSNSVRKSHLNDLFNLTTTYRRDSDIPIPYGRISERRDGDRSYEIHQKDKLVCWIVSNWNPDYERSKYYEKLKEHVRVETYGMSFNRQVNDDEYPELLSSCKFYLSFENSCHEDYITEKLYKPMQYGAVPVVLGPSRKNYEKFLPGEAFIHVDDYKSAEELAAHLKLLDQNPDMYMKYFRWREHYTARGTWFGFEHACWTCDYIRKNKNYRTMNDLNSWYWGL